VWCWLISGASGVTGRSRIPSWTGRALELARIRSVHVCVCVKTGRHEMVGTVLRRSPTASVGIRGCTARGAARQGKPADPTPCDALTTWSSESVRDLTSNTNYRSTHLTRARARASAFARSRLMVMRARHLFNMPQPTGTRSIRPDDWLRSFAGAPSHVRDSFPQSPVQPP